MNKVHDCIVVGAGPAGGAAAYHLAKRGRDVAIVEKHSLPRYKPCGGGVSPQIGEWFDFDFNPVISTKVNRFRYTWQMGDPVDVELKDPVWMVKRDEFDHFLVRQSIRQGAMLNDNTTVQDINFKDSNWHIDTSNGQFQARYLIAADGAKGQTAKKIGLNKRLKLVGGAIELEARGVLPKENVGHFEFGLLEAGYLWNFPKADGQSLGAGIFRHHRAQDLKTATKKYIDTFGINFDSTEYHAHPLYVWNGNQALHNGNERAVLVGEAACLADPLTAEGIRPSIYSGIQAAEAIDKALAGNNNAIPNYTRMIAKQVGTQMNWARRFSNFIYSHPQFCYRYLLKNPTVSQAMGKLFSGEMNYSDVPYKALLHLTKSLIGM